MCHLPDEVMKYYFSRECNGLFYIQLLQRVFFVFMKIIQQSFVALLHVCKVNGPIFLINTLICEINYFPCLM